MEHIRVCEKIIHQKLQANKVLVLLGSRRVGKTQLIHKIIKNSNEKTLFLNGDDVETHNLLILRKKLSPNPYFNIWNVNNSYLIKTAF